jgi:hypothetical protein
VVLIEILSKQLKGNRMFLKPIVFAAALFSQGDTPKHTRPANILLEVDHAQMQCVKYFKETQVNS